MKIKCIVVGSALLLSPLAAATYATPQQSTASPAPASVGTTCNEALYRFLPGDVSYCVGMRAWRQHRYAEGLERYKRAASWGSKAAQYALGLIYFNGREVPVNRPLGIAWLVLAAERNDPQKVAVAASAVKLASSAERQRANQLLVSMSPQYRDATAAARAKRHFDRAVRKLGVNPVYTHNVCIPGLTGDVVDVSGGPTAPPPPPQQLVAIHDGNGEIHYGLRNWLRSSVNKAANPTMGCASVAAVKRKVEHIAGIYFDGWLGHVSVGPLQAAQAPPHHP